MTRGRTAGNVIPKEILARAISEELETRGLSQTQAAWIAKDAPSQLSLIVNGKLKGFSSERLVRILTRLGRDVEIRVAKASGRTGKVRVTVQ